MLDGFSVQEIDWNSILDENETHLKLKYQNESNRALKTKVR